ncbi:hypothetical protein BU25DRAFT_176775 [Macroventuria anomochaeta]|uniref:Uncharacterized protein n=1 Tax=Macroventuria anomochaeta TaxID=301207 RepID=A0ACB6RNP0_9PLEO|nr:uncharacterized protein BU25DRAFT_176775 [Macroventuria anomochaeta]KAF2623570.1 hypothetical protein BU25DRAFT_176775 [Macroventuria anomochaeta]
MYFIKKNTSSTYDHRTLKTRLPVRSALFKQRTGGLVVRWVTTSEYLLLYVFGLFRSVLRTDSFHGTHRQLRHQPHRSCIWVRFRNLLGRIWTLIGSNYPTSPTDSYLKLRLSLLRY